LQNILQRADSELKSTTNLDPNLNMNQFFSIIRTMNLWSKLIVCYRLYGVT